MTVSVTQIRGFDVKKGDASQRASPVPQHVSPDSPASITPVFNMLFGFVCFTEESFVACCLDHGIGSHG
jgi:hypothetical protein